MERLPPSSIDAKARLRAIMRILETSRNADTVEDALEDARSMLVLEDQATLPYKGPASVVAVDGNRVNITTASPPTLKPSAGTGALFAPFLSLLLNIVAVDWLSCFTATRRSRLVDDFFQAAPADEALFTLCSHLALSGGEGEEAPITRPHSASLDYAADRLAAFVRTGRLKTIFDSLSGSPATTATASTTPTYTCGREERGLSDIEAPLATLTTPTRTAATASTAATAAAAAATASAKALALAKLVVSVPERVANALRGAVDYPELRATTYSQIASKQLVASAIEAMYHHRDKSSSSDGILKNTTDSGGGDGAGGGGCLIPLGAFAGKLALAGHAADLAHAMVDSVVTSASSSSSSSSSSSPNAVLMAQTSCRALLVSAGAPGTEALVVAVLRVGAAEDLQQARAIATTTTTASLGKTGTSTSVVTTLAGEGKNQRPLESSGDSSSATTAASPPPVTAPVYTPSDAVCELLCPSAAASDPRILALLQHTIPVVHRPWPGVALRTALVLARADMLRRSDNYDENVPAAEAAAARDDAAVKNTGKWNSSRSSLVLVALESLMAVWGDEDTIAALGDVRHAGMTHALLALFGALPPQALLLTDLASRLTQALLPAVQAHLGAALPSTRARGMLTAEVITGALDPERPLSFGLDKDGGTIDSDGSGGKRVSGRVDSVDTGTGLNDLRLTFAMARAICARKWLRGGSWPAAEEAPHSSKRTNDGGEDKSATTATTAVAVATSAATASQGHSQNNSDAIIKQGGNKENTPAAATPTTRVGGFDGLDEVPEIADKTRHVPLLEDGGSSCGSSGTFFDADAPFDFDSYQGVDDISGGGGGGGGGGGAGVMEGTAGDSGDGSNVFSGPYDSDEELQPYAMDDQTNPLSRARPAYLRDCISGLGQSEDADRFEACLADVESLIREVPGDLPRLADRLVLTLLGVENQYASPQFPEQRRRALAALAATAPLPAAEALIREFYAENYSLQHRVDALMALSEGAVELAGLDKSRHRAGRDDAEIEGKREKGGGYKGAVSSSSSSAGAADSPSSSSSAPSPSDIIAARLEAKTRRFTLGRTRPVAAVRANGFAPYAGPFFFPLLEQFDRPRSTLDMVGRDTLVLAPFIKTLASLVEASGAASPATRHLAVAFVDFWPRVRYHPQPSVRRATLLGIAAVLQHAGVQLLDDAPAALGEVHAWLQQLHSDDPDAMVRELATACLGLLARTLRPMASRRS